MKIGLKIISALLVLVAGQAFAETELVGEWQGKLAVDSKTSLTIQFTFARKPDGSYSAVVNSPDNAAIKNVTAGAVSWNGGALKVDVPALSGSYSGTLKDNRLEGTWAQPGSNLPLVLTAHRMVALTKAQIQTLTGTWHGPIAIPGASLTFVFRFKPDAKGELQGTLAVPEQGGVELQVADIQFDGTELSLTVPRVQGRYTATYANGGMNGNWKQGPGGGAVVLKKGDYAMPVLVLKLSPEAFAALSGAWQGKIGPLNTILRFEKDAKGQYLGFLDSPDQGANGIPMNAASLDGSKLTFKIDAVRGDFSGELKGKTLTGTWTQVGNPLPVVWTHK